MDETDASLSGQAKEYLSRKLNEKLNKIKKLKRKRNIVKILYYASIILSVFLSAVTATLSGLAMLPIYFIPILSTTSGILTGLSAKFNLQNKKTELDKEIKNLHEIQEKLDQVISCNGDFTKKDYQQLITKY